MNHLVRHSLIHRPQSVGLLPYTGAELFGWWDPSDSLNVTKSGGRFDQVNDKSGNGNHLTSTGAFRPFESRTVNGLEVMDFQSGQYIRSFFTSQSQINVLIHVSKADSIGSVWSYFDSTNQSNRQAQFNRHGANNQEYVYAGNNLLGSLSNLADTDVSLFTIIFNGASSIFYKNGDLIATGDAGNLSMGAGITVGSKNSINSEFMDGCSGDYLMYNSIITNAQLNQTGQYLANKYAISYTDIT